jgi:hypothetical protein
MPFPPTTSCIDGVDHEIHNLTQYTTLHRINSRRLCYHLIRDLDMALCLRYKFCLYIIRLNPLPCVTEYSH